MHDQPVGCIWSFRPFFVPELAERQQTVCSWWQEQDSHCRYEVDQDIIEETTSEKLLGVMLNNKLTWKEYLHGDNKYEGLITQLKKRVWTLKRLAQFMSKKRLWLLSRGIFHSKLVYCLAVTRNISGIQNYREGIRIVGLCYQYLRKQSKEYWEEQEMMQSEQ